MSARDADERAPRTWKRLQRRLRAGLLPAPAPRGIVGFDAFARDAPDAVVWGPSPGERIQRKLPFVGEEGARSRFEALRSWQAPPRYVLEIEGGRVYGEGVILTPDNRILRDVSLTFRGQPEDHWLLHRGPLPRARRVAGRLAVLASAGEAGYFHWLFDVLPRLDVLGETPYDRLLVSDARPFQRAWLDMLGIPADVILPTKKHAHIEPDALIVPSLPSASGNVTRRTVDFLRAAADRAGALSAAPAGGGRRIYVSRGDAARRRVLDEDAVLDLLRERGFVSVQPGALPAAEQVRLFSEAEFVVGPHGAGLANLVFCHAGTRVLELFAPSYVNVCYWSIGELVGARYGYLLASGPRGEADGAPPRIGDPIEVDLEALRTALDRLEG